MGIDRDAFRDPPKEYTIIPFWFINKVVENEEISRQIDEMVSKGVYGFFIHPRRGIEVPDPVEPPRIPTITMAAGILWDMYFAKQRKMKDTPYLQDTWWRIVSHILREAERRNMEVGIYDELDWPSGTAGMRIPRDRKFQAMHILPSGKVLRYDMYIDPMNPDATDRFIEMTHEEYRKRYGEMFGKMIKYFFTDEVTLSHHFICTRPKGLAPWSSIIEEEFRREHGYDLRPLISLLWENKRGCEKVRCDYWSTVSRLYSTNFHGRIKRWCEENGVLYTGHVLGEEAGFLQIRCQANIFDSLRNMHIPGVDHLSKRIGGCHPRIAASTAHHIGAKRVLCESYGASGWDLTMWDMRRIANWLFVNGINLINPHGFYLSTEGFRRNDYPPSQFFQFKYWNEYRKFADYIRRVSYALSQGTHDPDVAVYYPTLSLFANHDFGMFNATLNTIFNEIEYIHILLGMIHMDYDFLDEKMIVRSEVGDGKIRLGEEEYRALIIPCATTLNEELFRKLREIIEGGVKVIFTTWLPFHCIDGSDLRRFFLEIFKLDPEKTFRKKYKVRSPFLLLYHGLLQVWGRFNLEHVLMRFPLISFSKLFRGKYKTFFIFTTSGLSPRKKHAQILESILGVQKDPEIVSDYSRYMRIFRRKLDGGKIYFIANLSNRKVEARIRFPGKTKLLDFDSGEIRDHGEVVKFLPFDAKGFCSEQASWISP